MWSFLNDFFLQLSEIYKFFKKGIYIHIIIFDSFFILHKE